MVASEQQSEALRGATQASGGIRAVSPPAW